MGVLTSAISWVGGVIWDCISWIGSLLGNLFQGLIDILVGFFEVIYGVIYSLLYLVYKIGVLAVKIFTLFFDLGKLVVSFVTGLAKTLSHLFFSPLGSSGNGYSSTIGKVFSALEPFQLNVIAYILLFIIWISTAVAVVKLLGSVRVGGD